MKPYSNCHRPVLALLAGLTLASPTLADPGSRLWATGGVTNVEGSAGGGLVPWAVLAGYASDREWGGTITLSRAVVADFTLHLTGVALNWRNRVEVSIARQTLDLDTLGATLGEDELSQDIVGVKARLFGDVLYSDYGQWSLGLQHKRQRDFDIPEAIGAEDDQGTDMYLSASKLFFAAVFDRNLLVNATVRGTKANQGGLLGFGGDRNDGYQAMLETSVGLLLNRSWVVGAEYRQKPDNLGFAGEDDWWDGFVAWIPDRRVSVTAAWTDLGDIAGLENQRGLYLSPQGSF
jgi:hypothetical protein